MGGSQALVEFLIWFIDPQSNESEARTLRAALLAHFLDG
jgi:hypothetical protein